MKIQKNNHSQRVQSNPEQPLSEQKYIDPSQLSTQKLQSMQKAVGEMNTSPLKQESIVSFPPSMMMAAQNLSDLVTQASELSRKIGVGVIGREEVVREIALKIAENDAANEPTTIMLTGGPGVGKTHLLKSLAQAVNGDVTKMLSIHCDQFRMAMDINSLLGAPAGFVGSDRTPQLIQMLDDIFTTDDTVILSFEGLEHANDSVKKEILNIVNEIQKNGVIKMRNGDEVPVPRAKVFLEGENNGKYNLEHRLQKVEVPELTKTEKAQIMHAMFSEVLKETKTPVSTSSGPIPQLIAILSDRRATDLRSIARFTTQLRKGIEATKASLPDSEDTDSYILQLRQDIDVDTVADQISARLKRIEEQDIVKETGQLLSHAFKLLNKDTGAEEPILLL